MLHSIDLSFPWSNRQLLNFITCCSMEGLKYTTVVAYISTVRREHRLAGFSFTADDGWSAMLLKGMKTSTPVRDKRVAVTPRILWILKQRIKASDMSKYNKLMLWCIAVFMFFGAFRVNEILSSCSRTFMDNTLTGKNITWSDEDDAPARSWISVALLAPKEKRQYETVKVELLGLEDPVFCPVTAWRKWRSRADRVVPLDSDLPVFRFDSGMIVTGAWLNSKLQSLLRWDIDYTSHGVLTHSFRYTCLAELPVLI